jgi:methylthioribose-1-phosphate isomerase
MATAIVELAVRGAPAIGVAAAWGMALSWDLSQRAGCDATEARSNLAASQAILAATRPTAVNLFWALDRQAKVVDAALARDESVEVIGMTLVAEAALIREEDVQLGRAMGTAGAELLPDDVTILTHCNAGGLATGGYGTALGVVYAAQESGKTIRVFADETRPLLQGARLTAWELQARNIPVTILCDGAAGSLLSSGCIDAVITGADRIARNGDAANKIGTYPLAVLAREHQVPFYVVAPSSTFDQNCAAGSDIPVEMRDSAEILGFRGKSWSPDGVQAWNPAFDVTPAELITAIISEHGVHRPPYGKNLSFLDS